TYRNAPSSSSSSAMPALYQMASLRPSERIPYRLSVPQDIADSTDRLDELGGDVIQLLSQIADVYLHDVGVAFEVVAPHPLKNGLLAEHLPRVEHEQLQQVVLPRRQLNKLLPA